MQIFDTCRQHKRFYVFEEKRSTTTCMDEHPPKATNICQNTMKHSETNDTKHRRNNFADLKHICFRFVLGHQYVPNPECAAVID